jgi:polypeptide N-acetylgalactosaminyltransferase
LIYLRAKTVLKFDNIFPFSKIHSVGDPGNCVDDTLSMDEKPIGMYECSNNLTHPGVNQRFELSFNRDISSFETRCIYVTERIARAPVITGGCTCKQGNQFWRYEPISTAGSGSNFE